MNLLAIPAAVVGILYPSDMEIVSVFVSTQTSTSQYKVELADSAPKQIRGLMFRSSLQGLDGMLFVYPDDQLVQFWMKNVRFPLDILFVDRCGRLTQIYENALPDDATIIASKKPVRAVLELRGGATKHDQIQTGDRVHTTSGSILNCKPLSPTIYSESASISCGPCAEFLFTSVPTR